MRFYGAVYPECLEIELELQGVPFRANHQLALTCKDRPLKQTFKPDFVCSALIVVEIKAVSQLLDLRSVGLRWQRASGAGSQLPEGDGAQTRVACEFRQLSEVGL